MNIQFIGTGTMGSVKRSNTSILVDNILFDCGMGTIKQFERLGNKVQNLNYLVISHFHADHFFDIPNLIFGKIIRNEINEKFYIIGPKGIKQKVYDMISLSFGEQESLEQDCNIEFIELLPNETMQLKDYKLTSLEVKHGHTIPCYGYLLEKNNIIVGYTGDTTICENFYKMCEHAKYIFADTTMPLESSQTHIGVNDLIHTAQLYNTCKFYAVHRADYKIPNNSNVIFPNDGDKLII